MPLSLSNVPKKNPGRYFEKFVKIVQPIGEGSDQTGNTKFSNREAPATQEWSQTLVRQTRYKNESTNTGFIMKN